MNREYSIADACATACAILLGVDCFKSVAQMMIYHCICLYIIVRFESRLCKYYYLIPDSSDRHCTVVP